MSDGVNWRIRENRKDHRTSCYAQNDLILRRGQDFRKLKIKMTLTYLKKYIIILTFYYFILQWNFGFSESFF